MENQFIVIRQQQRRSERRQPDRRRQPERRQPNTLAHFRKDLWMTYYRSTESDLTAPLSLAGVGSLRVLDQLTREAPRYTYMDSFTRESLPSAEALRAAIQRVAARMAGTGWHACLVIETIASEASRLFDVKWIDRRKGVERRVCDRRVNETGSGFPEPASA